VLDYEISLEDFDEETYEIIDEGIVEVERLQVDPAEPQWFQMVARDSGGKIIAGSAAKFHHDVLEVDTLWVEEALRGTGMGRELLGRVEAHGRKLGARIAWLETKSWQARPFYEKHGYAVFGELPFLGGRHAHYFMRKDL
jgi:N-acetylglutamate synthase-like GNAT family acetyltransferase